MNKTIYLITILCITFLSGISQTYKPILQETVGGLKVSIYLPPSHSDTIAYKVLYVNDGQTIFGPTGLNMDGMANELTSMKLIEPIIIVGIHSGSDRTSQYLPYQDSTVNLDFGQYQAHAASYSRKIVKVLIPFIKKKYKTKENAGIAGYSFGGLHATWIALNYPDQFSFSGSLSPSYWVKNFKIFEEGRKARTSQTYYFDVGTSEWNYYVPWLMHSKLPMLKNIFYYEVEGARHVMDDWRGARVKNMLLIFAGNTNLERYSWDIQQEVIYSVHTGKFYLRINPIIHFYNGLLCSVSYAATFALLNPPEDGVVNKDGSYVFLKKNPLKIKVSFRGEDKIITVDYDVVEKTKLNYR